jgi:hypothetical protein
VVTLGGTNVHDTPDTNGTDDVTNADESNDTDDTRDRVTAERWLTDPVLDADLPPDVRAALGRLTGAGSVPTLGDWIADVRRLTGGGGIGIGDLCHAEAETPHWGELDGERYHFLCFYDAVLLSGLAEEPVDILTESPEGAVIQAHATGTDDLTVTPPDAVVSFGVERAAAPSGDALSPSDLYAAVCPYVKAFPDRDAYRTWAAETSGATVAMPLAGATEVAAALIE